MHVPSQSSLDALFARVTSARVSPILAPSVLVQVRGDEARALRDLVRISDFDGRDFHCMCRGDLALELFDDDSDDAPPFATLGLHHGISLRFDAWGSDALLLDGRAMLAWLAARGAPAWLRAFEDDRARARVAESARVAWIDAAPACLLPLEHHESPDGMRLDARSTRLVEAEARVRAAYASPDAAAAALLAWYGSSAGPYSGFPSYEALPEQLLFCLGPRFAREAAASSRDDAVVRGAARFFASWEMVSAKKSELADIDDALWARMKRLVPAVSDNADRLARASEIGAEARARRKNPAPVKTASGAMLVGVGEARLHGIASDGKSLYVADGKRLVAFAPGSTIPRVLHTLDDPFFELAYCAKMLLVTEINRGVVAKLVLDGPYVPMATGRTRPMSLASAPAVLAWLEPLERVDATTNVITQDIAVVRFDQGACRIVAQRPSAFCLVADRHGLFWLELANADVLVVGERGPIARFARPQPGSSSPPRLAASPEMLLVADDRALLVLPKSDGALTPLATLGPVGGTIEALVADDFDVFALTASADRTSGRLEHVKLGGGPSTILADYERPPWDRGSIVLDARAISWTTQDRVLSLSRR